MHALIRLPILVLLALGVASCGDAASRVPSDSGTKKAAATAAPAATSLALYADSAIPTGPLGVSIRRGRALLEATHDSLPAYTRSNLRCTSCHLERGMHAGAASLVGVTSHYPRFIDRAGAVIPIEDRVNYCFTRSLAGVPIPSRSREMVDIVAYLTFLSRGDTRHYPVEPGMPKMPALQGDSARGAEVFATTCVRCHGADGAGTALAPALWGPRSFSIGASMARVERAASFVRHNMPIDRPGTVSDQQAFDVAAFVDSHARPDLPGKAEDWPNGGAPSDVPYAVKGHTPARVTPVLPSPGNKVAVPVPTTAPAKAGAM